MIHDLLSLPQSGVYALIDDVNKRIYVDASYDVTGSLVRLAKAIRDRESWCRNLSNDIGKLRFVVLEKDIPRNKLKLRLNYWYDRYQAEGYDAYHRKGKRVSYRVIVDAWMSPHHQLLVNVLLVNKRGDKTVVGVFHTLEEADAFRMRNYADGVYDVVYDDGTLSKRYIKKSDDGYE
jgi:hypothetical protein